MAITPIDILFRALGVPQMQSSVAGVAGSIGTIGSAAKKTTVETEHLSSALDRISKANSGWNATRNAKELDAALSKVGSNNGMAQAELRATHFIDKMETAKAATQNVTAVLERMRNAGMGLALAGAGGIALSKHFQEVAHEGDAISARLNDLLEQQGRLGDLSGIDKDINRIAAQAHLPDDDPVREAATQMASDGVQTKDLSSLMEATVRQARTVKKPIEDVGAAMAKAYAEGSLTRLRRMNILFSDQEIESVKAAHGISEAAGQLEFMRVVLAATDRNAVALGAGLTEAQKAANDLAREGDTAMTNIGEGADAVSEKFHSVGAALLALINQAPGLEQVAGGIGYVGSNILLATGGLLTFASQIGMAKLGLQAMGISGVGALTAIRAAAITAGTAVWAVIGPLLPVIIAIGAAMAAITAVAVWYQNRQAQQSEAEGLETDKKLYPMYVQTQKKYGRPVKSFDEWRGNANEDDTGDAANQDNKIKAAQASLDALKTAGPGGARALPAGLSDDDDSADMGASATAAPSIASTVSAAGGTSQAQLDALDDAARAEKNPKGPAHDAARAAHRAHRDQRAAEAAQKRADASAHKDARFGAKASSAEITQSAAAQDEEMRAVLDERKEQAKDALEEQIEAIRKQVKQHLIKKDAANDKIDNLKDAQQHLLESWDQEAEAQSDRLKAQAAIASATAMAATQSGAEAEATMRVGMASAAHLNKMADFATKRAQRELQRSKDVGTTESLAGAFANFAKRTGSFVSRGGGPLNPYGAGQQTYTAVPSVKQDPLGGIRVQFGEIRLPQNGMDGALGAT